MWCMAAGSSQSPACAGAAGGGNRRSMSNPVGPVPLTLVTGPANAEKAGFVLGAYRAALDDEPILVVPTFADVDHYRRELAAGGRGLRRARRRLLGPDARDRAPGGGGRAERSRGWRASAWPAPRSPGSAWRRSRRRPPRRASSRPCCASSPSSRSSASSPGAGGPRCGRGPSASPPRAAYAEELARLYGAYRDGLRAIDRRDRVLHDQAALDALRLEPARWGATPVFLYGFDDLQPPQRDAIETLAVHAGAPVTVSLAYEPGRAAFAGRGETFQELMALGPEHVELPPLAEHYDAPARLHALERTLFEPPRVRAPRPAATRCCCSRAAGSARRSSSSPPHVARLIGERAFAPEDVAVVLREPREHAALLEQVFGELEIPYALDRTIAAGHTALGRGLVALLRCALLRGQRRRPARLAAHPGQARAARPGRPPRAARARIEGAATAAQARRCGRPTTPTSSCTRSIAWRRPRADPARAVPAPGRRVRRALRRARIAARRAVLAGPEALDARVAGALRSALGELERLAAVDRALVPAPEELARVLHDIEVRAARRPAPRARGRSRARGSCAPGACARPSSAACGRTPSRARPRPSRSWATTSAARSTPPPGCACACARTAWTPSATCSTRRPRRPTELLALSWHAADDEGEPCVRSLFVDDVLDSFDPRAAERVERRVLGAAGFEAALAPTANEAARHDLAAGPGSPRARHGAGCATPRVLRDLNERSTWSASALESYASCPVKWFVERLLRPAALEPDPEPMLRGDLAHRVLEDTLRALSRRRPADARAPRRGPRAAARPPSTSAPTTRASRRNPERRALGPAAPGGRPAALPRAGRPRPLGLRAARVRAALRRRRRTRSGRPSWPAASCACRAASTASTSAPTATRRSSTTTRARARRRRPWIEDGQLQVGLYLLALPQLLDLEAGRRALPAAGPRRRRAPARAAARRRRPGLASVAKDRLAPEDVEALPAGVLDAALEAVRGIRVGRAGPRPDLVRLPRRLRVPDHLPLRGGLGVTRAFTPEQREAIARREGDLLLLGQRRLGQDVGAGRALRAPRRRGRHARRPGPRHHVHREGGGRAARARPRPPARARRARGGARGRGRVDHDLPRLLRADPARARGRRRPRPGFAVLDAADGARPRSARPSRRALADFLAATPARRRARPRGRLRSIALQRMIVARHDELRSARADAAPLPAWRARPTRRRARRAGARVRGVRGRARRRRAPARRSTRRARRSRPARVRRSTPARPSHPKGREGRAQRRRAARRPLPTPTARRCEAYARRARRSRRRPALALLDELLGRYADAYAAAKRARGGVDFDDLELLARDLLAAQPGIAAGYARALRADHGRRVPGHQRRCSSSCSSWLDARQRLHGRRRAAVDLRLPPRRRRGLPRAPRAPGARAGRTATLATNFRTRPEILARSTPPSARCTSTSSRCVPGARRRAGAGAARRAAGHRRRRLERRRAGRARRRAARPPARSSRPRRGCVAQRIAELVA